MNANTREELGLLLCTMVPVLAFFGAQEGCLLLSPWVCATGQKWALFLVLGAALAGSLVAGGASWRRLKAGVGGESVARRRFLAVAGLLLNALSFMAILALSVPAILHRPCD